MGRAFEELGWEVISLDVDSKASLTICADICSWEPLPKFAPGYFDMIWASPVCTEYSRVLTCVRAGRLLNQLTFCATFPVFPHSDSRDFSELPRVSPKDALGTLG